MSGTPDRPSDLSRIFDEFLVRRQRGESPSLDDYCQRFPDFADQLRMHVGLYDALGEGAMSVDIRVEQLLANLEPHQAPEDVCGDDKELLREVRARWEKMGHVKKQLDDLFPNQEQGAPACIESFASPHELPRIDGYDIESVLGRGGVGVVFRARHLRLGRPVAIKMLLAGAEAGGKVWPLLARSQEPDDPRVRSYQLHRFGPLGAEAAAIVKRLEEEKDVTVRRALVLSLGEFSAEQLPQHSRRALLPKLHAIYQTDADAGLHGAVEWLLRHWDDRE